MAISLALYPKMPIPPKLDASVKARCLAALKVGDLVKVENSKHVVRVLKLLSNKAYIHYEKSQQKAWVKLSGVGPPF